MLLKRDCLLVFRLLQTKVGRVVTLYSLFGTTLARLVFFTLEMKTRASLASLGDSAVLDNVRFGVWVVFVVA